jgi:hypothetical protein
LMRQFIITPIACFIGDFKELLQGQIISGHSNTPRET